MDSARQRFDRKILAVIIAVAIASLGWIAWQAGASAWLPAAVKFDDITITARVVRSEQARERGLSGTEELAAGSGMLFVYDTQDKWGIWMRDMQYPIDIIWLDDEKRVVHIVHGAQPSSYPKTIFSPKKPAQYVLEVPAQTARNHAIRVGDSAEFEV